MFVSINSISMLGLDVSPVEVEISTSSRGLPCFDIVGLPAKSIAESKHRVKMSFGNLGLEFPTRKRVIVNLAPADLQKQGSFYDLPIAMGILCAQYNLSPPELSLFFGELSLDGHLRHVGGAFLLSTYAYEKKFKSVFVPAGCVQECLSASNIPVFGLNNLMELYKHIISEDILIPATREEHAFVKQKESKNNSEYIQIVGQDSAKRALEISAAGRHNIIFTGSPGVGKSMLARSLNELLPEMTTEESREVTKILSCVGKIPPSSSLVKERPYRAPHHTTSYVGMVGGGNIPVPGEVTLSHKGILFLDEINEFPRAVLESLRQPLEEGEINIVRNRRSYKFPADFLLVAARNPCPCGYYGHPDRECTCSPRTIYKYQNKLSGPFMDRIDLQVGVFPLKASDMTKIYNSNSQKYDIYFDTLKRIQKAVEIQKVRNIQGKYWSNSKLNPVQVQKTCRLTKTSQELINGAMSRFSLSARAYIKVIKVARTIADLEEAEVIRDDHVAEALQYRIRTS